MQKTNNVNKNLFKLKLKLVILIRSCRSKCKNGENLFLLYSEFDFRKGLGPLEFLFKQFLFNV